MSACPITVQIPFGDRTTAVPCGKPAVTDLCADHQADRERLAVPTPPPFYVTTRSGLVHVATCGRVSGRDAWRWEARNDGPGVARACEFCLPDGLPGVEA